MTRENAGRDVAGTVQHSQEHHHYLEVAEDSAHDTLSKRIEFPLLAHPCTAETRSHMDPYFLRSI